MKLFIRPVKGADGNIYSFALTTTKEGTPTEDQILEQFPYTATVEHVGKTARNFYRAETVENGEAFVA